MTTFTDLLVSLRVTNHFILQKYKCILTAQCSTLLLYLSLLNQYSSLLFEQLTDIRRRGGANTIRTFWVRPNESPSCTDSPQAFLTVTNYHLLRVLESLVIKSNLSIQDQKVTEPNTPTGDYCIEFQMEIYCVTTQPKTFCPRQPMSVVLPHNTNRTICFSVKYHRETPMISATLLSQYPHVTFNPITRLSLQATKASLSHNCFNNSHSIVGRGRFALPKSH